MLDGQVLEELGDGTVHVVGLHGAQAAGCGVDAGAPPSWLIPTSIPVNSATICGPETKATASEFMTTRSERPSSSAGPETTGPVAAAMTGHLPAAARAMAAAARPQPCRAATPSSTSAPLDATKKTNGMPSSRAWSAASASRTPSAWVMAPRRMVPSDRGNDDVAPTDPPDLRRDGTDDPLADGGRLFQLGHRDRM